MKDKEQIHRMRVCPRLKETEETTKYHVGSWAGLRQEKDISGKISDKQMTSVLVNHIVSVLISWV